MADRSEPHPWAEDLARFMADPEAFAAEVDARHQARNLAAVHAHDLAGYAVRSWRFGPFAAWVIAARLARPGSVIPVVVLTAAQVEQAYRWADDFMRDHIRQPGQVPPGHPDAARPAGWGEHPRDCDCGDCP